MKNKLVVSTLLLAMSVSTLGCATNTSSLVTITDRVKVTKKRMKIRMIKSLRNQMKLMKRKYYPIHSVIL